MSRLFNTDYQNCPLVGRSVCVRRTEVQCRAQNDCTNEFCPLQGEFAQAPIASAAPEFSSRIGFGWLAGRFNG
jgi:hypothetical protein